jgi:hypothetical protein
LWRYFFFVSLHKRVEREKGRKKEFKVPVGCASICLWGNRTAQYMSLSLTTSNKGWHKQWFYLKNDHAAPLLLFFDSFIESASKTWVWGPLANKQDRIEDHLKAIAILRERGLCKASVIGAYHVRRLAPLMACTLSMYQMMPGSPPDGTVMLTGEVLSVDEVEQRLKEATEVPSSPSRELVPAYLVPGHPPMRPDAGFVEFVSPLLFFGLHILLTF